MAIGINASLLRLLDANANRAREALRVLEDYARFGLDDGPLSARLKAIRHGMAQALSGVLAEAIIFRDTPADVGVINKLPTEAARASVDDVVTAAGKRLSEALRALEEYCKVVAPPAASQIEALRYQGYDVEQQLALTLPGVQRARFANVRLYVLITEAQCRRNWLEAAKGAIAGGVDCLQLREKSLDGAELLRRARLLADLCRPSGVLLVVNDRPDIAILSQANGVHVGQGDLPARDVRKIVGRDMLIGVSTREVAQARQAVLDGADYVGIGPVFRSSTKPRDFVAGLEMARAVVEAVKIPVVAIAGITLKNVDDVKATGVSAIAVTAAVVGCEDVEAATRDLKRAMES